MSKKEYHIQWISILKSTFLAILGALGFVIFYCYQNNNLDIYLTFALFALFIGTLLIFAILFDHLEQVKNL